MAFKRSAVRIPPGSTTTFRRFAGRNGHSKTRQSLIAILATHSGTERGLRASDLGDCGSGRLRECNCNPKEGLGVRWTPGFSKSRRRAL